MTHARPTSGNTYALGRFSAGGPTGYVAVHDDGTHGPRRTTRAEAEADYAQAKAHAMTCQLLTATRQLVTAIREQEASAKAHDQYRAAGFDAGYGEQFEREAADLYTAHLRNCDAVQSLAHRLIREYGPATYARMDDIAWHFA